MDPKRTYFFAEEEAIEEALLMGEITEEEAREQQRELEEDPWGSESEGEWS